MQKTTMTVQANNAINKNVRVEVDGKPAATKEKQSHITLTGENGRLTLVLPYEQGKDFELDQAKTITIE